MQSVRELQRAVHNPCSTDVASMLPNCLYRKPTMLAVLANRTYRHLFLAQVIALVGTGLATVALGLLAYDLAGKQAGAVLGTALAIKMIAYIGVAPVVGAFADRLPRRAFLVAMTWSVQRSLCCSHSSTRFGRSTS